jgi:hypothetical protein
MSSCQSYIGHIQNDKHRVLKNVHVDLGESGV